MKLDSPIEGSSSWSIMVTPSGIEPSEVNSLPLPAKAGSPTEVSLWRDISLVDGSLLVIQPKSGQREVLPLNAIAHAILSGIPQTHDVIFPNMPKGMTHLFLRLRRKAGLPDDIMFHCLRDTYISRLAPYCAAPTLMTLARHRNFSTTQRYLRVDEHHLRMTVERLADNSECLTVMKTGSEKTKTP